MVETDCPFLAPVPHRGKRNEPAWVARTAEQVADLWGVSVDEAGEITTENALRFFRIG
jgi:TatD DNase family protein